MSKKLRLGFIGGGLNSAVGQAHYVASRMDGRFEVVAGCFSRDAEINRDTAEKYDAIYFNSVEDLLKFGLLDAVSILTPTPTHFEIIKTCLKYNIPIICEKALCSNIDQSRLIIEEKNKYDNALLYVTFNYTGYAIIRELQNIVMSGALGGIISIQAEMPQEGYLRDRANPQEWRLTDGEIPAVHLDLGTHLYHLINYITNDYILKLVSVNKSHSKFNVIDDVNCLAEFSTGFTANMWFGKTALGHRNGLRIRINGTLASAEWLQTNPEALYVANHKGHRMIYDRSNPECIISSQPRYQRFKSGHPSGFLEAFANIYDDFADAIERKESLHFYSAEIAHEGLRAMYGIANAERIIN